MQKPKSSKNYWRESFRRSIQDWGDRNALVSVLVISVTALGYGLFLDDPRVIKGSVIVAAVYVGILFFIITPWRMWRDAQQEIRAYEERLQPRLGFVFKPGTPPYVVKFDVFHSRLRVSVLMYRVGIENMSGEIVRRVRVVVESAVFSLDGRPVAPDRSQPALIETALNVMGIDEKDGAVDLSPGDRPTAYIDVAEQMTPTSMPTQSSFSLCYATRHRVQMQAPGRWVITLRAEGGGTYCRARFAIEATDDDKSIVMSRADTE